MCNIQKITMASITEAQFQQIVAMERKSGLEPYTPEMLMDCIDNLQTFACLDGESVLGFITVNPASKKFSGGSLYVVNINVRPQSRRQGIGAQLLDKAIAAFPACKQITLDVDRKNTAAIALYRKMGFRDTDTPSENGDTDVVMIRDNGNGKDC